MYSFPNACRKVYRTHICAISDDCWKLLMINEVEIEKEYDNIMCSGLTTLAKNRETWLLPQRTWERSEDMTGRHVFAKMCVFFHFFFCIWSVSLLISCLYLSYLTLNSCFIFVLLLLLILYLLILDLFIFALKSVNDI